MDRIIVAGPDRNSPRAQLRFKMYSGNRCVFSQLTRADTESSSIRLAPKIVEEIGKRVGMDPRTLRFFDLQSPKAFATPGRYEFDEVVIDQSGAPNWQPLRCPRAVARDFLAHAPRPRQRMPFKPITTF